MSRPLHAVTAVAAVLLAELGGAVPAHGAQAPTPQTATTASPSLPVTVTLDQALALLAERSPRTAADRATIAVAEADRVTAKTLPNPSLSYGASRLVSGLSTGAVTQHQLVAEQPLLIFHQRAARLDTADTNVRLEEARVAESFSVRRLAVRQAFAELLARQEQLQVLQDGVASLERVAQVVRGRAAAGDRSEYDVLRIDTEADALRVQVLSATADVADASGQLAAVLGLPGWAPRAEGRLEVGAVPTDVETLWTIAQRRSPSLVVLARQEAATKSSVLLAQRERLPVPSVSGGSQFTRDVTGKSAFVGLSVPLQFFDHNQGPIAKATAQATADGLALQAAKAEQRAEIDRAVSVLVKRREALARLEGAVVQRLPRLRQMAEDAYREGKADILDLLDANRTLREFQVTHVQQLEAVKLAEEALVSAAALDAADPQP